MGLATGALFLSGAFRLVITADAAANEELVDESDSAHPPDEDDPSEEGGALNFRLRTSNRSKSFFRWAFSWLEYSREMEESSSSSLESSGGGLFRISGIECTDCTWVSSAGGGSEGADCTDGADCTEGAGAEGADGATDLAADCARATDLAADCARATDLAADGAGVITTDASISLVSPEPLEDVNEAFSRSFFTRSWNAVGSFPEPMMLMLSSLVISSSIMSESYLAVLASAF